MIIIAAISILIYGYGLYCLVREVVLINKSILEDSRTKVHLSILFYAIITKLGFIFWIFDHEGIMYGLNTHLVNESMWLFLIMFTIFTLSITRYFRKQRQGDELLVSHSGEFKRTMSFGFSKDLEFEEIVKRFSTQMKNKGLEVEYVREALEDIEHLKSLKDKEVEVFSESTFMEKVGNILKHDYIFHNKKPLVFFFHEHIFFSETVKPLDEPVVLYLLVDDKIKTIPLSINDNYTIPKGVKHAMIFSKPNRISLKWN